MDCGQSTHRIPTNRSETAAWTENIDVTANRSFIKQAATKKKTRGGRRGRLEELNYTYTSMY